MYISLIALHHLNKFLMELSFISHENLRIIIHRAINKNPCPVSTVGAVTRFVQYFVVVAVFLVLEN